MRVAPALIFLGLIAVPSAGGRAEGEPAPAGEVLQLPPMIVEAKNAPLRWRHLALPGFELLTVCDDEISLRYARRHQQLLAFFGAIVPERHQLKTVVPEAHILLNEEVGRMNSREVLAQLLEEHGGRLERDGGLRAPGVNPNPLVDLRYALPPPLGGTLRPYEVYFMPNLRLNDRDSVAVFSILPGKNPSFRYGFTEDRVRFMLERRVPGPPDWLVAGVAGFMRQAELSERGDEFELQPFSWLSAEESQAVRRNEEWPRVLLPVEEMLAGRATTPAPPAGSPEAVWVDQCALFVRWALTHTDPAMREGLWRLVDRLEAAPFSEALLQDCFGLGASDLRDRLSDYLSRAVRERRQFPVAPVPPAPGLRLRPATSLEIARLRGSWERREIPYVRERHSELAAGYLEQARRTLRRAYEAGERDPRLLAELGLTELEGERPAEAAGWLEAAVAGGVESPHVLVTLARLRYDALPAGAAGLSRDGRESVLGLVRRACASAPPLLEAYVLAALVAGRAPAELPAADRALLEQGVEFFPTASAYVGQVIALDLQAGQPERARKLAERGLRHARDEATRQAYARMLERLASSGSR